jgi:streptogramin lyase
VYAFDAPAGSPVALAVSQGDPEGRAAQPSDVAVADDGKLFLADFERRTIVMGTEDQPLMMLPGADGSGGQLPRVAVHGDLVLVAEPVAERIFVIDGEGKQRGAFVFPPEAEGVRPSGMVATADGLLYVVDLDHERLYRLVIDAPPIAEPIPAPSPEQ